MWPSTLTTFTNPLPSQPLNAPSHSSIETAQNSAATRIETFVGVLTGMTASAVGTLLYDIRSPDSDGGGHIQTANKGGTGQTSYNKGDLLVASSSSVLTKLAVGSDGQILKANSSVATGVQWGSGSGTKLTNSATSVRVSSIATEVSVMSTTVLGSTLGTDGAVRGRLFIANVNGVNGTELLKIRPIFGNTSITTFQFGSIAEGPSVRGILEYDLIANQATNSQRGVITMTLFRQAPNINVGAVGGMSSMYSYRAVGSSSEDSNGNKSFGVTVQFNNEGNYDFSTSGFTTEKIT